jgi:pimeloyl-ACP methyl ester carboxylesterase
VTPTRFDQRDIEVDGMRLRYVDEGPTGEAGGPEPLVVIPGHTARIEGFDEVLPTLAARRRVVVADLPGSGYSDKPERTYSVRFYEDVVLDLLDALGIDRAIPVGGSLGGNLVLRLGHRAPTRFPRLVVWAPGSAWPAKPMVAAALRRMPRALFWPVVRGQSRFWYSPDFPGRKAALADTFAYYREVMSPGFLDMYFGLAADQVGTSLFPLAPHVDQPILLMWGDRDHGGGMGKGVARLAATLPHVDFVTFRGARHSLEAEVPGQLGSTIADWLDPPSA